MLDVINTDFTILNVAATPWDSENSATKSHCVHKNRIKPKNKRKNRKADDLEETTQKANMDPFFKLENIDKNLILNHLNVEDFFSMREVSKNWKKMVESCEKFIGGTSINVTNFDAVTKFLEQNSCRNYKFIEIGALRGIRPQFIKNFAYTLETIDLKDYDNLEEEFSVEGFEFKKLKSLKIFSHSDTWLNWLATCKVPSLMKLQIDKGKEKISPKSFKLIMRMLTKMPSIKQLTITEEEFDGEDEKVPSEFFTQKEYDELLEKLEFKLETAQFTKYPIFMDNLLESLIKLNVSLIHASKLKLIYEKCKQLKELTIESIMGDTSYCFEIGYKLPKNESITSLGMYCDEFDQLLTASPNVEELTFLDTSNIDRTYTNFDVKFLGEFKFFLKN